MADIDTTQYNNCFDYHPSSEITILSVENGKLPIDSIMIDSDNNLLWVKDGVSTFKMKDGNQIKIAYISFNELVVMSMAEDNLKNFILRKLGYPIVRVELTMHQLKDSIEEAIEELAPWVVQPKYITVDANHRIDLSEFNISYVINIIPADRETSVSRGVLNGSVSDIFSTSYYETTGYRDMLYRNIELGVFERTQSNSLGGISWSWIDETNELLLDTGYTNANRVTIEYSPKIRSLDDLTDDIYLTFAKKFALAFARATLADIRGKFSVDGSPVTLDASEQAERSNSELERLRTELKETVSTHFMID